MEVEAALRRFLLSDSTITGYVGDKVYKHELVDDELVESGGRALVVRRFGGWTAPNVWNTQEFPLVNIQCWADAFCLGVDEDPIDNAWALYRAMDPLLHGTGDVTWGGTDGLYIVHCQRHAEPLLMPPAEDQAGARYVSVMYAVQTFH